MQHIDPIALSFIMDVFLISKSDSLYSEGRSTYTRAPLRSPWFAFALTLASEICLIVLIQQCPPLSSIFGHSGAKTYHAMFRVSLLAHGEAHERTKESCALWPVHAQERSARSQAWPQDPQGHPWSHLSQARSAPTSPRTHRKLAIGLGPRGQHHHQHLRPRRINHPKKRFLGEDIIQTNTLLQKKSSNKRFLAGDIIPKNNFLEKTSSTNDLWKRQHPKTISLFEL